MFKVFMVTVAASVTLAAPLSAAKPATSAANQKAYDRAIECSSAVAIVAALVAEVPDAADIAAQMRDATPKWIAKGRTLKLKSDDAVMEDHKAAAAARLQYILEDTSAESDRSGELAATALGCIDELG